MKVHTACPTDEEVTAALEEYCKKNSNYKAKVKIFKHRLNQIHKDHTPEKWERRKRYNWKKSWGPYVKYQADWDGCYLLDLIIYKLERMYAELDVFSDEVRDSLDKRLTVLKETIELGKKLQTYEYDKEYYEFSKQHTTHYALIYKIDPEAKGFVDRMKSQVLIHKMPSGRVTCLEDSDDVDVDDILGLKAANKWCKENGYVVYKDVEIATTSEWDSDDNYKQWKKLIKKANKEEQADTDKFFKLISRNYRGWWW